MNLEEIRERIEENLQTRIDKEDWRDNLTLRINDANRETLTMFAWTFRNRQAELHLLEDQVFATADIQASPDGRTIRVNAPADWDLTDTRWLEGHTLSSDEFSNTTDISGTPSRSRPAPSAFVIEDALQLATGGVAQVDLKLDPRFVGPSDNTAAPITFKAIRYALPMDCASVLGIVDRVDRSLVLPLSPAQERYWILDPDVTGPEIFWTTEPNRVDSYPFPQASRYQYRKIEPPRNTPTAVVNAGGALDVDVRYQYRIAWIYAGMVSEPGPLVEATPTGTDLTVDLSDLDVHSLATLGRRRLLYRRRAEGPWVLIATLEDPSVDTFTDAGTFDETDALAFERERDFRQGWDRRYLRFWPRPAKDRILELRYLSKPKRLIDDSDVPEIPEEYHALLVHRVTADIAAVGDGHALRKYHNTRYTELLGQMSTKYLEEGGAAGQRQSALGGRLGEPLGSPVVWTGPLP